MLRRLVTGLAFTAVVLTYDAPDAARACVAALHMQSVPLTAILKSPTDAEGYAVYVLEGSGDRPVAKLRDVRLGEITGNRIAVLSGLTAGERVVVTGTTIVANGDAVRVIP